jgi:hypothetical protein
MRAILLRDAVRVHSSPDKPLALACPSSQVEVPPDVPPGATPYNQAVSAGRHTARHAAEMLRAYAEPGVAAMFMPVHEVGFTRASVR